MLGPITMRLATQLPPTSAFDVFTRKFGDWWPSETQKARRCGASVSMAPEQGGRIEQLDADGSVALWGRIFDWRPGALVAFTWMRDMAPEDATRVTVAFTEVGSGGLITLTHDGWRALGSIAAGHRAFYAESWNHAFCGRYADACRRALA